MSFNLRDKIEM